MSVDDRSTVRRTAS